jgi:hypothetical protein
MTLAGGVKVFGNYKGPGMWIDHWNSLIALQPDFVEIVTWNDYPYAHTPTHGHFSCWPSQRPDTRALMF